jgi:hypothetical protein
MAAPGETDIFHHVRDATYFHLPFDTHIPLPHIFGFQLTKYMVLQLVAGFFVLFVFRGLSRRIAAGGPPEGPWWNFWETLALYIRDNVVRPTIGVPHDDHGHGAHGHDDHGHDGHGHDGHAHGAGAASTTGHPADRFLPYVWTCFFYVLICNLLGAFPWLGSPTSEINVTGALAGVTVIAVMFYGMRRSGVGGFWLSLAPSMDQARGAGDSSFCEHDGRPYGHRGDHAVYRRNRELVAVSDCAAFEYLRTNFRRHARAAVRVRAGVHFCLPGDVVYRNGGQPALIGETSVYLSVRSQARLWRVGDIEAESFEER